MFEYFGWCSWDAFYHEVSHKGIIEKMQELKDKRIPAKWVLIDDGWLDADYKKQVLKGLDADADKFPDGLGACIREIKQDYDVKQVGVWHAVMGYWNGLEKDSSAGRKLRDESRTLEDGRIVPDTEPGRAFAFYDTWHSYLKNSCDVDFVKVDGQSAISLFYAGRKEYGRASAGIQKGLNASAALHFNNRIINCMGMAGEDMWNRPSSAISRSSDDLYRTCPTDSGNMQFRTATILCCRDSFSGETGICSGVIMKKLAEFHTSRRKRRPGLYERQSRVYGWKVYYAADEKRRQADPL